MSNDLRAPLHHVSRSAIPYWAVRASIVWAVILIAQLMWAMSTSTQKDLHVLGLLATLVLAAAYLTVMPLWRYRVHRWEHTADAVYTQSGWFTQERRIAPVSRIQTVDTVQGPFEQLFGLTTVTVTTASAAGPLEIAGLDQATAAGLVHELTALAQAAPDDAT